MSTHAPLPPSAAHRWMSCPGSVHACKGVPSGDSIYSAEGTFAHAVAAELLFKDIDAKEMIGFQAAVDVNGVPTSFTFDAAMAAAVQTYLNVVRGIVMVKGGTLLVEQKVRLSPDVYGTADALIWSEDKRWLDVVDLKMGSGVFVDAEENEQLIIYALGALAERGIGPHAIDGATIHVVQPRFHSSDPHREWPLDAEKLEEWRRKVAGAALATRKPDAPLVAGKHCRFCPVRSDCKALQSAALTAAQDVFPDLDPQATPLAPPLPAMLTGEQLARILRAADAAETWIKAVRENATDRARAGEAIPGFKIVQRLGHRKWIDEAQTATELAKLNVDPWAPRELMSPAALEKKHKGLKGVVAQLTTRPVSGEVLAPDHDHRPAISAGDVFSDS